MKIVLPRKVEVIDVAALAYVLFSIYIFKNRLVHQEQLYINVFMILMYLKVRFIK